MVRTKAEIRATYDRIAEPFAARRREPWPEVRSFIESLPRDAQVLDLGAGNGRHAKILSHRGNQSVALDFSLHLLRIVSVRVLESAKDILIDWFGGIATK